MRQLLPRCRRCRRPRAAPLPPTPPPSRSIHLIPVTGNAGIFYLYMKTAERAHLPNKLWESQTAVGAVGGSGFPSFLPRAVERIRDSAAIHLAKPIERVPIQTGFAKSPILSSCVRPLKQQQSNDPVVLLHVFDSSCLEWRYTYPLLEEAGLEAWAVDILGWGFSNLETRPPCDVALKCEHLYQFWRSYIKRPMVLVGPSLGAAVAIDFVVNYPGAVQAC